MITPIVVGRQAIQDRDGATVGYELLFRAHRDAQSATSGPGGTAAHGSDEMTAEVALSTLDIGLDQVVGGRLAFHNADRGMLVGEVPIVLPPDRVVIEMLETVVVDDEVLEGCRQLVEQGYPLALDDFVGFDGDEALLELASIVKIDIRLIQGNQLETLVQRCRRYRVKLLAEKVETADEYAHLRAMGFDLFQGYYLERPLVITGRTLAPSALTRLRLSTMLLCGDVDADDLLELLHGDPGLAMQVMKLAAIGQHRETRRTVTTIRDALILAGSRAVQNWMALLSLRQSVDDSAVRFVDVLVRARAVETMAGKLDPALREVGFAAGMLSALDLLFGGPKEQLRESLQLHDLLAEAAFGSGEPGGSITELRRIVEMSTDYQLHGCSSSSSDNHDLELDSAFAEALTWTAELLARLSDVMSHAA